MGNSDGKRERLEASSERIVAQKKGKHRQTLRVFVVSLCFVGVVAVLVLLGIQFAGSGETTGSVEAETAELLPTIEVVDEDMMATGGKISNRMSSYIGQIEGDFKDLGYTPVRAVIPAGTVREIDFYFADFGGYVKTTIDRGTGVTAEDMDRMVRYLAGREFEYIDVRVAGKGYWK